MLPVKVGGEVPGRFQSGEQCDLSAAVWGNVAQVPRIDCRSSLFVRITEYLSLLSLPPPLRHAQRILNDFNGI
jgi:hypothetical protein